MRLAQRLCIDLPATTAFWVLSAHAFALTAPLVLAQRVVAHAELIAAFSAVPFLWIIAAALFALAAGFEIAQNWRDRWYLTEDCGSAERPAALDLLFYACAGLGHVALTAALMGVTHWGVIAGGLGVAFFVVQYFRDREPFLGLFVCGLASTTALFVAVGDPIVWLALGAGPLTLYCYRLLLRTGAQSLHAMTAAASSTGLWLIIAVLERSAAGTSPDWTSVLLWGAGVGLMLAIGYRPLSRLARTRRPM